MTAAVRYHAGLEAERSVARQYLRAGHKFLAHRYKTPHGEIDLVMEGAGTIIFIEVKKSTSFAAAAERVSNTQIARITEAARIFLGERAGGQDVASRFDVALVNAVGEVDIVENAFAA